MSDIDEPLRPDKNQRTLFSLAKVVRLDNLSMCFTIEEIIAMRDELRNPSLTKHEVRGSGHSLLIFDRFLLFLLYFFSPPPLQLLIILRKLDCYKLQVADLQRTDISAAVATLAAKHPKPAVAKLASSILQKWRDIVETSLFQPNAYDVDTAQAAPDGEAAAPEDLIEAEKEQQRLDKLDRRRQRIEEDFMAVSSSDDEKSETASEDPEWAPSGAPRRSSASSGGGGGGPSRRGSSRSGIKIDSMCPPPPGAAAAAPAQQQQTIKEVIEKVRVEEEEIEEDVQVEAMAADDVEEVEEEVAPVAVKKKVKAARPTILEMLQKQVKAHAEAQSSSQQQQAAAIEIID